MERSREAGVLLGCAVLALLVLAALASNAVRLGSAITREVKRAELDYISGMGRGERVETNALLLGYCLREEMVKSARVGIAHPDTWAVYARIRALPACTPRLPELPPPTPSLITAPRARPIITSLTQPTTRATTAATTPDRPPLNSSSRGELTHVDCCPLRFYWR